jgi:hypothetical protein
LVVQDTRNRQDQLAVASVRALFLALQARKQAFFEQAWLVAVLMLALLAQDRAVLELA